MPISSSAATLEKKRAFRIRGSTTTASTCTEPQTNHSGKNFLTIEPALPQNTKKLYRRSHSTLSSSGVVHDYESVTASESITLQSYPDGSVHIFRIPKEKEKNPDRISLDRRGLTALPVIKDEPRLRLLSLQHNLINNLDGLKEQKFPYLVFLDMYDNQLERINCLDTLENLRVLLMGKNRIKRIEGLQNLVKMEVLDLHGNQIVHVNGLATLNDLKVLNLAGNQIRTIGATDLQGLSSLQELNLRRNRLKKLLGFGETLNLQKLFISNNEIQTVEDMCSVAKSSHIREIAVDNNPVSLGGDSVSFLVSYLPQLALLNNMQITDQVRKAAMAWRRNKESSNAAFMDLTSDVCLNVRREEVISNARTNWELIRSQTKCLTTKTSNNNIVNISKNLKPECDIILTSLAKPELKNKLRSKSQFSMNTSKVPVLPDKKLNITRTSSQDTENSQNTSTSNASSNEFFRLPPILVPIINKLEQKNDSSLKETSTKLSGSLSSVGPNVDSSVSSLLSNSDSNSSSASNSETEDEEAKPAAVVTKTNEEVLETQAIQQNLESLNTELKINSSVLNASSDTGSNISTNTTASNVTVPSAPSESGTSNSNPSKNVRNIKSAANLRSSHAKIRTRAATAKPKKQISPSEPQPEREREQGGDYLIEICGRHLNVYGQGALRFIDKPWSISKAKDVNTVNFNYANFNSITGVLSKLKQRFPNIDNFVFKETNIQSFGQLNALAEVQGLFSLSIDDEGNPIVNKKWQSYAIYRLSHWGLRFINGKEVTDSDIKAANEEYQSLSDIVLWSLPDVLLQPLLIRLRLDVSQAVTEQSAKKWLLAADPALKSVVSKEALQWKKGAVAQDDLLLRQKAKFHIGSILSDTCNAVEKLRYLDREWPTILHDAVRNILLDYSQIDLYMKNKIQELK